MSILNPILSQSDDDMLGKGIVPGASGQDTESSILGGIKSPTPSSSLGASLDPGQQIPGSKMHQAGKDAYAQLMPKITADAGTSDYFRQRQEQLEFEKDHPNGAPISKHPGTFGTILHGIAKAGNLAGEILAPGTLENIPGTELHRDRESRELQTSQREAETQENQATQAAATKEKADTEARMADQAKPKEEKWGDFANYTDLDGTPLMREENSGQVVRADNKQQPKGFKTVKPEQPFQTDKTTRIENGVPHEVLFDKQTGADVKDLGQTKVPGESADSKRSAAESAQVEREARGNIRKAEGQYRATQQTVGQLTASIDAAKDGNGLLTSFVPTMEVLGINASNGVHRISPAEAQAAQLPGGWAERFNAWFDKASTGKLSPQLQQEGKALAEILARGAYQRYKSTYDDESGIVSGYGGTDFNKRVPLIDGGQGGGQRQRPANVPEGYEYKDGPKGRGWYKPNASTK